MLVRLTIFLETSTTTGGAQFVAGDNVLIKQILGENALTSTTLTFKKGTNLMPNEVVYRNNVNSTTTFPADKLSYYTDGYDGVVIKYTCDYGTGALYESVVLADNKPVIRFNALGVKQTTSTTLATEKEDNNTVVVGGLVHSVTEVSDTNNGTILTATANNYASSFGDYISSPFSQPITSQTTRYVSKDGSVICFSQSGNYYFYKNDSLRILPINATAFTSSNVSSILMAGDYVIAALSVSPYLEVYKITNLILEKLSINTDSLNGNVSFNLTSLDFTVTSSGSIRICGIAQSGYGKCYIGSVSSGTLSISSEVDTTFEAAKAVALYHNNFCDSLVLFMNNNATVGGFSGVSYVQMVNATGSLVTDSDAHAIASDLLTNATAVYGTNRVVYSVKASTYGGSLLNSYFFPDTLRYNIPYDGETDIWVSHDFNYVIKKYSGNVFKIYTNFGYNTLSQFSDNLFSTLDGSTLLDFEFLKDTLLIFTSSNASPVLAINLNEDLCVLEGLTSSDPDDITVVYDKYNPLGASSSEQVEARLTLTISGGSNNGV